MCDGIERSLKKGSVAEKIAAIELATVICVQLGGEDTSEDLCKLLKPILLATVCDKTVAPSLRAKVELIDIEEPTLLYFRVILVLYLSGKYHFSLWWRSGRCTGPDAATRVRVRRQLLKR